MLPNPPTYPLTPFLLYELVSLLGAKKVTVWVHIFVPFKMLSFNYTYT